MFPTAETPTVAAVLHTLVAADDDLRSSSTAPDGHRQCIHRQFACQAGIIDHPMALREQRSISTANFNQPSAVCRMREGVFPWPYNLLRIFSAERARLPYPIPCGRSRTVERAGPTPGGCCSPRTENRGAQCTHCGVQCEAGKVRSGQINTTLRCRCAPLSSQ